MASTLSKTGWASSGRAGRDSHFFSGITCASPQASDSRAKTGPGFSIAKSPGIKGARIVPAFAGAGGAVPLKGTRQSVPGSTGVVIIEETELDPEGARDEAGGRVAEVPRPTVGIAPRGMLGVRGMWSEEGRESRRNVGGAAPRRAGCTRAAG
jgi:hypothetical protein